MLPSPLLTYCRALLAVALLAALGGAVPEGARAQKFGRVGELKTNAAYFYYAKPGEATIQVAVWGVPRPGLYEVPDGTSLDRLLTLAGGVNRKARKEGRKPPRVTVRLFRPDQSRQDPHLKVRLQELLRGTVAPPQLQGGDIVVVETVRPSRFTWRDGLSIVTTAASLALLVLRFLRFGD